MPQITQTLHAQLDEAESQLKAAIDFYSKTRENLLKTRDAYHVHMEKFKLFEEEGEAALAVEEKESAASRQSIAEQLSNQLIKAKDAVQNAKARYSKLVDVANGTRIPLPQSEVESIARRQSHEEALRIGASKGIAPNSAASKKLEKKLYPHWLKQYQKLNKNGSISAV